MFSQFHDRRKALRLVYHLLVGYLIACCIQVLVILTFWSLSSNADAGDLRLMDTIELLLGFISISYACGSFIMLALHTIVQKEAGIIGWLVFGAALPLALVVTEEVNWVVMGRFNLMLAIPGIGTAVFAFVTGRVIAVHTERRRSEIVTTRANGDTPKI